MALRVFADTNSVYRISAPGISLQVSNSKLQRFRRSIGNKLTNIVEKGQGQISIKSSEVLPFTVPVKISPDTNVSSFRDLDYSYYIEAGEFYPKSKPYQDYLCVTNATTFITDKTPTKEFEPWSDNNNVWKTVEGYGFTAYWSQHYARGKRLYVKAEDLALALIIDASVQKALIERKNKELAKTKEKIQKAVDDLFKKFPNSRREILNYIRDNFDF